ncbi:hypothetical protein ABPG75_013956 [Micractinium tetrahymenae]
MEQHALLSAVLAMLLASRAEAQGRTVCFITNYAQYRPCNAWQPRQLNATLCTHVHFAFAFLNADSSIMLREYNDFRFRFSQAVATSASRARFINSTMAWLDRFGFDGIDIDWEYPGDLNRGGSTQDKRNLGLFFAEFRAEQRRRGKRYLLAMSTAAGAAGRVGLDMPIMIRTLDYISIMTYDFHGAWESRVNHLAPWKDPQGGTLDIVTTLDFYIRTAKWPKSKLNLGLAAYGRSWQLVSAACTTLPSLPSPLGSLAKGPGPAAECTGEGGSLAWFEIKRMIATGRMKVAIDRTAKAAYLQTPAGAWISFDLPETLWMKAVAARQMGLGGLMVWTADLDDSGSTMLKVAKYGQNPGSYLQYLPRPKAPPPLQRPAKTGAVAAAAAAACAAACGSGAAVAAAIAQSAAGLYCGGGAVGIGACRASALCCSQWGHCGTAPLFCSLDAGCLGGPCRSYAGTRYGQPPPANGTSMTDSTAVYEQMSALKAALGGR